MKLSISDYKSATAIMMLTFACLTGCGPRFSVPPKNDHPIHKITLKVSIRGATQNGYVLNGAKVHYTTKGKDCGFMDYTAAIGGIYKRPEATINFSSHGDTVDIYKDYFRYRQTCPFEIDQVIIELSGQGGVGANINSNVLVVGQSPSKDLKAKCEFAQTFNYYLCTNEGWFGFDGPVKQIGFLVYIHRL